MALCKLVVGDQGVPDSEVLGCADSNRMPSWLQQFRDELDGAIHFSEGQDVVNRVHGLS